MARINIEDQLFTDGRFGQLRNKYGEDKALGLMVQAFRLAQTYWAKDRSLIPIEVFLFKEEFRDLITVGLAEQRENGVYVRGAKEQFDWILTRKENGKKGGRPAEKNLKEPKNNLNETKKEPKHKLEEPNDNPQSQSQSQSQSQKKERESRREILRIEKIRDLFDEVLGGKGNIKKVSGHLIPSAIAQDYQNLVGDPIWNDLEHWKKYFEIVLKSEWLLNEFNTTFAWLVNPANAFKVMQGQYDNRPDKKKSIVGQSGDSSAKSDLLFDQIIRCGKMNYLDMMNKMQDVELRAVEIFGGSARIFDATNFTLEKTKAEFRAAYKQAQENL